MSIKPRTDPVQVEQSQQANITHSRASATLCSGAPAKNEICQPRLTGGRSWQNDPLTPFHTRPQSNPLHSLAMQIPTRALAILFACFVSLLLAACDVRSVDPVVKIGLVAPFEGAQRQIGYDIIYSARLAVREVNAAGGINGVRVSLVAYDDSTYPEEAQRVAQALVVDEGIVAVVGHWSDATNAAAEGLYDSAELAFIPMGIEPFGIFDAAALSEAWRNDYQAITYQGSQPPGLYAATAYDAMQLIFEAINSAETVNRNGVYNALSAATIEGLTGTKAKP